MRPRLTFLAVVAVLVILCSVATVPVVFASEPSQVLRPDGLYVPDDFGASVVVDGETLVVGFSHRGRLPPPWDRPFDSVRAHVFKKSDGLWIETQLIEEPFEATGGEIPSLALDGDWLAIGFPGGGQGGVDCGTVHMYARSGGTWTKAQVLLPPQPCTDSTWFGREIAVSAGKLAVLSVSSIHMFEHDGTSWSEAESIFTEMLLEAVDLNDGRLTCTWRDNDYLTGIDEVGIHVYDRTAAGWGDPVVLQPTGTDVHVNEEGGCRAIAVDGVRIALGCPDANMDPRTHEATGAVFVFELSHGVWIETATLAPPVGTASWSRFGASVDLVGDQLLVGASGWTVVNEYSDTWPTGAAYHFSLVNGEWVLVDVSVGEITQTGLPTTSAHGWSVAIAGNELFVGDPHYARDGRVSIYAPAKGRFSDDDDSVFKADIEWLAAEGITKGCNPPLNTEFCPDSHVTRGQMAAFLTRALGLTDRLDDPFVDDDDSIFEADIERLAAAGITKGCNPPTNDRFCPDGKVTREQMAAFLVRALGYTDNGGGDLFVDDDDSIFEADIDRLGTAGVTKGCNPPANDRYCPSGNVIRGQMAAFLHRALG